jgi:hypothetical protein
MKKCSKCNTDSTSLWRYDANEVLLCNACALRQYKIAPWASKKKPPIKRTKEEWKKYRCDVSKQFRRKLDIDRMANILDKVQSDRQKKDIIAVLAESCEIKVAFQLSSGNEVDIDISDIKKSKTFWRRLEDIVE